MTYIIQPPFTMGDPNLITPQPTTSISPAHSWTNHSPKNQMNQMNLGAAFEPKKAGHNAATHVVLVLDDSYSMNSSRDATISAVNEFIGSQKADAKDREGKTFFSLYKFDGNNLTCIYERDNISKVRSISREDYNPTGSTNLYDAIGGVMMKINSDLYDQKKSKRDGVIITIMTDGEENTSRTFAAHDIKTMIEKAEGKKWGFMFLGANIDAFAVGSTLGFNVHNTMQYDMNNIESAVKASSAMTTRLSTAYRSGMDTKSAYMSTAFTSDERDESNGA